MWGMNDLDTALFIAWFVLAGVWVLTLAYYREKVEYFRGRWIMEIDYTENLMRIYRGELMTEEEAEEEIQIDTGDV